ncbi:jmjC domain-containing protein 5 isoform X2 [Balamuthia mandrillaris]
MEGRREKPAAAGVYKQVPRLEQPSVELFLKEYWRKGKPVVITGALENWPALSKWNLDGLKEELKGFNVEVRQNTNTKEYRQGHSFAPRKMKFEEYVDDLQSGAKASRNRYMAVQNVKKTFPSLNQDFSIPSYVPKTHRGPFMWIAPPGHFEYVHIDPDDNFLCIVRGQKRVLLFNPAHLPKMSVNPLGSLGFTLQTQMDLLGDGSCLTSQDKPSLEQLHDTYPSFEDVVCEECTIQDGEILFIPFGYWHQVTSLTACISINFFCGDTDGNFLWKLIDPQTPFHPSQCESLPNLRPLPPDCPPLTWVWPDDTDTQNEKTDKDEVITGEKEEEETEDTAGARSVDSAAEHRTEDIAAGSTALFLYWFLNIVEQNRLHSTPAKDSSSTYPDMPFHFCLKKYTRDQLEKCLQAFLWTRYKEEATPQEMEKLLQSLLYYCERRDRELFDPAFGGDGTYEARKAATKAAARVPNLKIRGKSSRRIA